MKKIKILLLVVLMIFSGKSFAQTFNNAIGGRVGFPIYAGVDFKHNFGEHWGLDLGLGFGDPYIDFEVEGLYHFPIASVAGLRWYLGASLDVGATLFRDNYYDPYYWDDYYHNNHKHYNNNRLILGASILGGIEYTFSNIPLDLSFDFGPRLPIVPFGGGYFSSWFGRSYVAARYTF